MRLKTTTGIALTALLIGMLTLAFNIQPAESLEPPETGWTRTYGGANSDIARSVVQTSDGGYAMAGQTSSFGAGGIDFWLVKTDAAGTMEWNKTYGGAGYDEAYSVVETSDGGYAIAGYTESFGAGELDFWLVKVDSSGNMEWNKTYGGTKFDVPHSVVQTGDGGYAIGGFTRSFGPTVGIASFWLVKTDSSGDVEWNQTYGGGGTTGDFGYSVVQTDDGGYAIAGGGSGFANLVKTDADGNQQWSKSYGGDAYCVVETVDGGYALAGEKYPSGASKLNFWLAKGDSSGNQQWSKTYGGAGNDHAHSLVQTDDGGYAIAGYTESFGAGGSDFWLVKVDSSGNMEWNKTYGGTGWDKAFSLVQTNDGGYALAGYALAHFPEGSGSDFGLIKILPGHTPVARFTYSPTIPSLGEEIIFDASSSFDLDEDIVSYRWDFDDGNISSTVDSTIVHVYEFPGTFNVTLTVIDSKGLNCSYSQTVWVRIITFVSISTSSTSTFVGFRVNVTGTILDIYGNGLKNETVVLYYTLSEISTWTPMASGTTDNLGNYHAMWIPPATGNFMIKTEWAGNSTYFGTYNVTNLNILSYKDEYIFSVESNSTVSSLAFNTKNWTLSFTASGPSGTKGYVKVTVAKSLVDNITNIRVYLDGDQLEYSITSMDDSWFLTFNYIHSAHQIVIELNPNRIPATKFLGLDWWLWVTIIVLVVSAVIAAAFILRRRKPSVTTLPPQVQPPSSSSS